MKKPELQALISKAKNFGSDFNGTIDSGMFDAPKDTEIITGDDGDDYIKTTLAGLGITRVHYHQGEKTAEAIGKFKAQKIDELGIDVFFDDDPEVIYWINYYLDKIYKEREIKDHVSKRK